MSFIYEARNKVEELSGQAKEKTGEATGKKDLQGRGREGPGPATSRTPAKRSRTSSGRVRHLAGPGTQFWVAGSRWPWRYRATHARDGHPEQMVARVRAGARRRG